MSQRDHDIVFHYPPELLNLLVDAIPRLNRSKRDVLLFFRGAGVPRRMLADLQELVAVSPQDINKYAITRKVLERLNAKGEASLRERREVLKRVVEFTNYDACWPNDRLEAKGLVASIRSVVNEKDAFTRMKQERDVERQAHSSKKQRAARQRAKRIQDIEGAKREFYSLFGADMEGRVRGKKLESALNSLFDAYDILVKDAFHLVGHDGEGIVEQVDGVIEFAGHLYFVEMKWLSTRLGRPHLSEHVVRLMSRAEARGIFISATEFTKPALVVARDFLKEKVLVLATLEEIVRLLETQDELADFLEKKVNSALVERNPYFRPYGSGS